ncbi:MAG: hypothetical protein MJK15_23110 [Colwellia sp.]|nr:hypothetical protein [Colwellia sp.]
MPLPSNMTDLSSIFTQLGHRRVAQFAMAVLLVYIAYVGAKITWSVVPQAQSKYFNGNK